MAKFLFCCVFFISCAFAVRLKINAYDKANDEGESAGPRPIVATQAMGRDFVNRSAFVKFVPATRTVAPSIIQGTSRLAPTVKRVVLPPRIVGHATQPLQKPAKPSVVVNRIGGHNVIAPKRVIGGHGVATSQQIASQATSSHRAKKTIQVFAPGGGTGMCMPAYLAVQGDPGLALEVVGRTAFSGAAYDAYPHDRPQGPNHYTFAQDIIDGTFNEYSNIYKQPLRGTPLLDCDALIFGSRGGQSVLPYMWKELGDKVPPVVVINSGITQATNPIVRYRDYWPASAIVFLLVCGSDETFAQGQSPSQYLQNTLVGVPPDTATTAVLYVKELTHMPDPTLMAKVYPEMAKSVIDWKENGKPDVDRFKKIVGAISAHTARKYTGELRWKVGATATSWDSLEFP